MRFPQANAHRSQPTCIIVRKKRKEKLAFVSQIAALFFACLCLFFPFFLSFFFLFSFVESQRSLRVGVEEGFKDYERNVKGYNYCVLSKTCCSVGKYLSFLNILFFNSLLK